MTKAQKTNPTNSFHQGKDLYNSTGLRYEVYLSAALWAARDNDIPLATVKEKIRTMVSDHIVQELGFLPMDEIHG